jgi:hypothetical protein
MDPYVGEHERPDSETLPQANALGNPTVQPKAVEAEAIASLKPPEEAPASVHIPNIPHQHRHDDDTSTDGSTGLEVSPTFSSHLLTLNNSY